MRYGLAVATLGALLLLGGCGDFSFEARDPGPECSADRSPDRSGCRVADNSAGGDKTHRKQKDRTRAWLGDSARLDARCARSGEPRRLTGEAHLEAWLRSHADGKCGRARGTARRVSGGTSDLDAWLAEYVSKHDMGESAGITGPRGGTCIDVTSYDYNWDNDMLCTRLDGTQFFTDYAGADAFLG